MNLTGLNKISLISAIHQKETQSFQGKSSPAIKTLQKDTVSFSGREKPAVSYLEYLAHKLNMIGKRELENFTTFSKRIFVNAFDGSRVKEINSLTNKLGRKVNSHQKILKPDQYKL